MNERKEQKICQNETENKSNNNLIYYQNNEKEIHLIHDNNSNIVDNNIKNNKINNNKSLNSYIPLINNKYHKCISINPEKKFQKIVNNIKINQKNNESKDINKAENIIDLTNDNNTCINKKNLKKRSRNDLLNDIDITTTRNMEIMRDHLNKNKLPKRRRKRYKLQCQECKRYGHNKLNCPNKFNIFNNINVFEIPNKNICSRPYFERYSKNFFDFRKLDIINNWNIDNNMNYIKLACKYLFFAKSIGSNNGRSVKMIIYQTIECLTNIKPSHYLLRYLNHLLSNFNSSSCADHKKFCINISLIFMEEYPDILEYIQHQILNSSNYFYSNKKKKDDWRPNINRFLKLCDAFNKKVNDINEYLGKSENSKFLIKNNERIQFLQNLNNINENNSL